MIVKTSRRGGHTHSLAQLPGVVTSGWQDGLRVTSTRCRAWVKTDADQRLGAAWPSDNPPVESSRAARVASPSLGPGGEPGLRSRP